MASEMMDALITLAQEKHLDELQLLSRLEESLAESYNKIFNLEPLKMSNGEVVETIKVTIDRQTGRVYVYQHVPLDDYMMTEENAREFGFEYDPEREGDYTKFEWVDITPKDASRTAAAHAKMVINDMVRNAARQQIHDEFSKRIGELITGTVLQTTSDFTILKIREGVEAELPHYDLKRNESERNERPAGEYYTHNQRIRAVIVGVREPNPTGNNVGRGEHNRPAIIVSRTHPDLIRRLFELESNEVYDGIVEIKSVAREPGVRSKVAVHSLESRVDPVGACVGPKGGRVRNVVSELRGERIDIVLWDRDPGQFVANALSPARVTRVITDPENQYATVIVPDDQLSLAIGKEGQNARLAARLTGWHIDIKNETLAAQMFGNYMAETDLEAASDDVRCAHEDENGNRCRNKARAGFKYCNMHQDDESLI